MQDTNSSETSFEITWDCNYKRGLERNPVYQYQRNGQPNFDVSSCSEAVKCVRMGHGNLVNIRKRQRRIRCEPGQTRCLMLKKALMEFRTEKKKKQQTTQKKKKKKKKHTTQSIDNDQKNPVLKTKRHEPLRQWKDKDKQRMRSEIRKAKCTSNKGKRRAGNVWS